MWYYLMLIPNVNTSQLRKALFNNTLLIPLLPNFTTLSTLSTFETQLKTNYDIRPDVHFKLNLLTKMDTNILEKLERIEKLLETQQAMQKQVLNLNDACIYLELSQSHLYKLTSNGSIPHYKPNGKKLYFNRQELDNWLLRNRSNSIDEIEQEAANYLIKKGRVQL